MADIPLAACGGIYKEHKILGEYMGENKREQAFLVLFEASFHDDDIEYIAENEKEESRISAAALKEAQNVCKNLNEIDETIKSNLKAWDIKRISKVALAAMRLAVFEMAYDESIPAGAAVNEAVELCKKYSSEDEASFVNGVLRAVSGSMTAGSMQ